MCYTLRNFLKQLPSPHQAAKMAALPRGAILPSMWDVLGLGAVAVDDLLYVDRYPDADEKEPVRDKRREGGGLAGTALVAAARLGAGAAYCGALGDDELSRFTRIELEREGVDCSPVLFDAAARPMHSVIVVVRPTGQRTIYAAREGWREIDPELVTPELVARCRVLFVDHTVPLSGVRAAMEARKLGIPVVADIERLDEPGIAELLNCVDHLILSRRTALELTGKIGPENAVRALLEPGRAVAVVTDGQHGCWYAAQGEAVRHQPAFEVRVVDTTGCGDVFHGAYAACLARGLSLDAAIRTAAACAALKAMQPGGRRGIPSAETVEAFLAASN